MVRRVRLLVPALTVGVVLGTLFPFIFPFLTGEPRGQELFTWAAAGLVVGTSVGVVLAEILVRTRKTWLVVLGPLLGWLAATGLAVWLTRDDGSNTDSIFVFGMLGILLGLAIAAVMAGTQMLAKRQ